MERMKPSDYVYTETETITFKKLVESVEEAVDKLNALNIKSFYYKSSR